MDRDTRSLSPPGVRPPSLPERRGLRQMFRSAAAPCPYVPDRQERKLFTRLEGPDNTALNSLLTRAGFRRSHEFLYRPSCLGCGACVPVRIRLADLAFSRSQRRTLAANADLRARVAPARASAESYAMFRRYQEARHADGDMATLSQAEFTRMVEDGAVATGILEARAPGGRLMGNLLFDRLEDGASAVYSWFEPAPAARGFGTFLILALAQELRVGQVPDAGARHLYLGYWIGESDKMAYKARFRPLERLQDGAWVPFVPGGAERPA